MTGAQPKLLLIIFDAKVWAKAMATSPGVLPSSMFSGRHAREGVGSAFG